MNAMETGAARPEAAEIPNSVRYIKNGPGGRQGGRWWLEARQNGQIHAEWSGISPNLIEHPGDFSDIEKLSLADPDTKPRLRKMYLNQLLTLLQQPSQHIWITFEEGCLWWCTVKNGATAKPKGENDRLVHFWLTCNCPWSNQSLHGRRLDRNDLPGIIDRVAGFRGTLCKPREAAAILRLIRGEVNPLVTAATEVRRNHEQAVGQMISELKWQDFEQLVDLILARTAWIRSSKVGGYQEGFDIEAQNLAADEIAFVQVKSDASQADLDEYVRRFQERRDHYARMIFAVHNANDQLTPPRGLPIQVWTGDRLARLAVRLGLGEWVEHKLA